MYKLLIADDEQWIRQRLIETVDWKSIGIELVLEAEDGEQALQQTFSQKPDVIITDIRMPALNGLDFIQDIKKSGLHPKVIFLSGYNDFDYAQRALKLGAHDYILKPVNNDEILAIVKKCIEELISDAQKERVLKDLQEKLDRDKPVLKERFLMDLLNDYVDEQTVERDLGYFGFPTEGDFLYSCIIIQQDQKPNNGQDTHLVHLGIKNIATELYSILGRCEAVSMQFLEIAFLLFTKAEDQGLVSAIEENSKKIQSVIKKLFGLTVTVGIGEFCADLLDLPKSFEQAKQAVLYRSFLGGDSVYRYNGIKNHSREKIEYQLDVNEWLNVLNNQSGESIEKKVDELVSQISKEKVKPVDLKSLYIEVIMMIINVSYGLERISQTYPDFNMQLFTHLNELETMEGFRAGLVEMMQMLSCHLKKASMDNKRQVIKMVIEYIEQNYKEPITLNDAANEVYLNPTYLCRIFKLETGITFTKFIMNYRIKKAIELMEDPKLKVYEVAEMVGYSDVQYFTKIFKTTKGMSPTQYRDKII